MKKISIAIVVPVLNEERELDSAIKHLQTVNADELVFIDGGSVDSSTNILEQNKVIWYASKPGRAKQMNLGASKVTSDIILFLHTDTLLCSSYLQKIRASMQDSKVIAGRFDIILSGSHLMFRLVELFVNWRSRLTRISSGDQAMFIRRDIFESLGGFPDQVLMEDIEMSKRLKVLGKITCLHEQVVTSSRRWEKHGIFRTILLMWRLRFQYWLGADPANLKQQYVDHQ